MVKIRHLQWSQYNLLENKVLSLFSVIKCESNNWLGFVAEYKTLLMLISVRFDGLRAYIEKIFVIWAMPFNWTSNSIVGYICSYWRKRNKRKSRRRKRLSVFARHTDVSKVFKTITSVMRLTPMNEWMNEMRRYIWNQRALLLSIEK